MQKNQSLASLFLLFRKKARSAHLLVCKRTHNGSLSLPPFYEIVPSVMLYLYCSTLPRRSKVFCNQKDRSKNGLLSYAQLLVIGVYSKNATKHSASYIGNQHCYKITIEIKLPFHNDRSN